MYDNFHYNILQTNYLLGNIVSCYFQILSKVVLFDTSCREDEDKYRNYLNEFIRWRTASQFLLWRHTKKYISSFVKGSIVGKVLPRVSRKEIGTTHLKPTVQEICANFFNGIIHKETKLALFHQKYYRWKVLSISINLLMRPYLKLNITVALLKRDPCFWWSHHAFYLPYIWYPRNSFIIYDVLMHLVNS